MFLILVNFPTSFHRHWSHCIIYGTRRSEVNYKAKFMFVCNKLSDPCGTLHYILAVVWLLSTVLIRRLVGKRGGALAHQSRLGLAASCTIYTLV